MFSPFLFLLFFSFSESLGLRGKVMRKIEELKASLVASAAPDEFLCPITQEVMKDPVIAAGEPTTCSPDPQTTQRLQIHWIEHLSLARDLTQLDKFSSNSSAVLLQHSAKPYIQ